MAERTARFKKIVNGVLIAGIVGGGARSVINSVFNSDMFSSKTLEYAFNEKEFQVTSTGYFDAIKACNNLESSNPNMDLLMCQNALATVSNQQPVTISNPENGIVKVSSPSGDYTIIVKPTTTKNEIVAAIEIGGGASFQLEKVKIRDWMLPVSLAGLYTFLNTVLRRKSGKVLGTTLGNQEKEEKFPHYFDEEHVKRDAALVQRTFEDNLDKEIEDKKRQQFVQQRRRESGKLDYWGGPFRRFIERIFRDDESKHLRDSDDPEEGSNYDSPYGKLPPSP